MGVRSFSAIVFLLIVGTLGSATSSFAAAFDPSTPYRTIRTEHFAVHYAAALESVAQRAAVLAEEAHRTLAPKYRWTPWGRTQIVLTDNSDQAQGTASVLPYNWLLLRVVAPDVEHPLATYDDWLRTLIMHEYTHILHMDQVGGVMRVPRFLLGKTVAPNGIQPGWVREGLATYEETTQTTGGRGRASFSEMLLRTAVLQKQFPKIDQADGLGWRWPGANTQYIYGEKFLAWLVDKYGEEKLIAYQRRVGRSPLLFATNTHAKRIWGKSFYKLWKEWRTDLEAKYAAQEAAVTAKGLTALTPLPRTGAAVGTPVFSRDGTKLAYAVADYHRHAEIRIRDMATGTDEVVQRKRFPSQLSFAPDGTRIAFSSLGAHNRFNYFADVYLLDLPTKKLTRVTTGRRATDPDFAPDGKSLVYVVQEAGTAQLAIHNLAEKTETLLPIPQAAFTQYAHPRWAPDGKTIAVAVWTTGGYRDILLLRPNGQTLHRLTHDMALDHSPTWSADGRYLYFTSDRTGIPNVFRYDVGRQTMTQVTNVLTGVAEPAVAPDGKTLVVQHYTGDGYDLRAIDLTAVRGSKFEVRSAKFNIEHRTPNIEQNSDTTPSKKYSPFTGPLFLPRFVSPSVIALDSGVLVSAITGGADPLRWHSWVGGITYRSDASFIGWFGGYAYNRYRPTFDLSAYRYAVNYGPILLRGDGTIATVYEKRLRGGVGASIPWGQQRFGLQYFMENRDNLTSMNALERALFTFGRFAGVSATYRWGQSERLPASISPESGHLLRMHFTITDKFLGSHEPNEQQIFSGDLRKYFRLPWRQHVLTTRLAGGIAWGDTVSQGTFGLGGSLGEGAFAGTESFYYFPLRGLPVSFLSRTRAVLASAEYRIPIVSPQRGVGTLPVFLNNMHAAFFADAGNALNAGEGMGKWGFGQFIVGTGAELRGDFVLGHGLPITGRLGYGIVVANRDRLFNSTDPLFKNRVKYGMVILQLGTSF